MSGRTWERFRGQPMAVAGLVALGIVLVLALLAPLIAPQDPADPLSYDPLAENHPPGLSWTFLLGADGRGRSVLALLLWGGRTSLAIGAGAALLAAIVGLCLGALAARAAYQGWAGGALNGALAAAMDVCQAAPPLIVVLLLSAHLGGVPAPLMLAVFAGTGWVAPARLTRAGVASALSAPHVEAARAVGVRGPHLLRSHLLPEAFSPVMVWMASGAATYVAMEAGLDFLGAGLPPGTVSWGTALAGAQDGLANGNWWWMVCGGLALALVTLSLGAVARGVGRALDPTEVVGHARRAQETAEGVPAGQDVATVWRSWQPTPADATRRPTRARPALGMAAAIILLLTATMGVRATRRPAPNLPPPGSLLRAAQTYPHRLGDPASYIGWATYAATEEAVGHNSLPWAAWAACPLDLSAGPARGGVPCTQSSVQLWVANGRARALADGIIFVCTPTLSWGLNPMAGLAITAPRGCGPLGPPMKGLGATAETVDTLLPALRATPRARVLGWDVVASRRCWVVALSATGRACVDAATGLALRVERLDHTGVPVAEFVMTSIAYGLDLAPELFGNPIPGGHGPLVDGLTQPLLDLQAADDQALFTALVPSALPRGLIAQTPTFDSFYDDTRGYALTQRVRQTYQNRAGQVQLVLIETLPGCAWDVTPPRAQAVHTVVDGRPLLVWPARRGQPALVRVELDGTAALISSRTLPLQVLEAVAAGLR